MIFLIIDPCSVKDIRANEDILHEDIGIHDSDLDEALAEDILVHVAEVKDEELVIDTAQASRLHRGVLSLIKSFNINDRIRGFVEIFGC
jgi:hypothetical protein